MARTGAPDALAALTPQRLGAIRSRLLAWYDAHPQDFPWRTARDPYAALVAAVCAQQTQMPRVIETHARWMAAFPTLAACAAAPRAEVLRVWGRAGYPRRAVALHETARHCVEHHGGALPRDRESLLALPGVGPFTASIVQCFGFDDDAAAVDTNVVRVIGRLVFGDLQPARETPPAAIAAAAERLLRPGTAARWNPALMDYGARVCSPRPRCDACVVAALCSARPRFDAGERAEPVRAQAAFAGSDRQWRGRILRVLRERDDPAGTAAGVATRDLWRALAVPAGERARVRALLRALVDDGLAWSRGGRCGLGDRRA
jgi:A/G-specific adenine glycosylase